MNSIVIIIPYFGKLPKYYPFFIESCFSNSFIDFIFFTDDEDIQQFEGKNIRVVPFTIDEFNHLASRKLSHPFTLKKAYKLCDLKPMYGKIFEDHIRDYNFWGFSDLDFILGDLKKLLTPDLLSAYDILSFYELFISGPFCIMRNTEKVNTLFSKSDDIIRVLDNPDFVGFDEASGIATIWEIWRGKPILETNAPYESFSHVVLNPEKCRSRLFFKHFIRDENINGKKVRFMDGRLYINDEEIYFYHYLQYKGKLSFHTPQYIAGKNFELTKNGFFYTGKSVNYVAWFIETANNFYKKAYKKLKKILIQPK